jgi:hypothetical protein
MATIFIKLSLRVDLVKKPSPGLHMSTRKNWKTIFEILIFYMKKLRNNSCGYKLYM